MSEMIERVARALRGDEWGSDDWDSATAEDQEYWRRGARVAIKAMRNPTHEQYEALSATGKMWKELNSETVWQTYIDAALK